MKCNYVNTFLDPDMQEPCANNVTWNRRCEVHGGKHPTPPELMILLGKLTGWGDQSLSVSIGWKRARVYTAQDESHLDDHTRGFTVGTKVCGQDRDVNAQGPTLEEALWALCVEVMAQASRTRDRAATQAAEADKVLVEFLRSRSIP